MANTLTNTPLLERAIAAWHQWGDWRTRRDRFKRFTYGDQWSDIVNTPDGPMTRAAMAASQGRRPMTNNMVRRLVKSVVGRYRYNCSESSPNDGIDITIRYRNELDTLDCRTLEEFLISGMAVQRIEFGYNIIGRGTWVDHVMPDTFFTSPIKDPRGWDATLVGMFHDWPMDEALSRLAMFDLDERKRISQLLVEETADTSSWIKTGDKHDIVNFVTPAQGMYRVIEVWERKIEPVIMCNDPLKNKVKFMNLSSIPKLKEINTQRQLSNTPLLKWDEYIKTYWQGTFMTTGGMVLKQVCKTEHPFVLSLYPLIDGEIHPLVEDVIEQQVYINELSSMIDHVINCSAKGVLLFPEGARSQYTSWEEIARRWSQPDGLIPIRDATAGEMPRQLTADASSLGARELLMTHMQLFDDIAGVSNILMGRNTNSNMSLEQYESQVRNALITIADILDSFNTFIQNRNFKLFMNSRQEPSTSKREDNVDKPVNNCSKQQ